MKTKTRVAGDKGRTGYLSSKDEVIDIFLCIYNEYTQMYLQSVCVCRVSLLSLIKRLNMSSSYCIRVHN